MGGRGQACKVITQWQLAHDSLQVQLAAWAASNQLRCLPPPFITSVPPAQMVRECFARYLKLTRRALSDASAIAAATAAGITTAGQLVQPLEEVLRASELAAEEEAQGYGGSGAPSSLEESIAAGGQLQPLLSRGSNSACWLMRRYTLGLANQCRSCTLVCHAAC